MKIEGAMEPITISTQQTTTGINTSPQAPPNAGCRPLAISPLNARNTLVSLMPSNRSYCSPIMTLGTWIYQRFSSFTAWVISFFERPLTSFEKVQLFYETYFRQNNVFSPQELQTAFAALPSEIREPFEVKLDRLQSQCFVDALFEYTNNVSKFSDPLGRLKEQLNAFLMEVTSCSNQEVILNQPHIVESFNQLPENVKSSINRTLSRQWYGNTKILVEEYIDNFVSPEILRDVNTYYQSFFRSNQTHSMENIRTAFHQLPFHVRKVLQQEMCLLRTPSFIDVCKFQIRMLGKQVSQSQDQDHLITAFFERYCNNSDGASLLGNATVMRQFEGLPQDFQQAVLSNPDFLETEAVALKTALEHYLLARTSEDQLTPLRTFYQTYLSENQIGSMDQILQIFSLLSWSVKLGIDEELNRLLPDPIVAAAPNPQTPSFQRFKVAVQNYLNRHPV